MAERDEELGIDFRPALEAIDQLDARVDQLISKIGDGISSAFVDGSKAGLDALSALDAPIKLNVDDSEIQIAAGDIQSLGDEQVVVSVLADSEELIAAEADIEALIAAGQLGAEVSVAVDDSELAGAIGDVETLQTTAAEPIEVAINVDTGALEEAAGAVESLSGGSAAAAGNVDSLSEKVAEVGIGAKGITGLGSALTGIAGVNLLGPVSGLAGLVTFGVEAAEKSIKAEAAIRRLKDATGEYAQSIESLDQTGLNRSLATLALQLGASTGELRVFAARFFQLGESAGVSGDKVNKATQQIIALASYLSATNPQLGTTSDIVNRLSTGLARGGRFLGNYGISLTSAAIQQRALNDNVGKTAAELTVFEKSAAGAALATEQLGGKLKTGIDEGLDNPIIKLRELRRELTKAVTEAGKGSASGFVEGLAAATPVLVDLIKVLGELSGIAIPAIADALVVVEPLLTLVTKILGAVPPEAVAAAATAVGLSIAIEALGTIVAGFSVTLAVSIQTFAPWIAAAGALAILIYKVAGAQKEATKVSGAYTAALATGADNAAALITPTTDAATSIRILGEEITKAQKAAVIDKLKDLKPALDSIGVAADEAAGLFGNDAEALQAVAAIIGPLAQYTGAYKGALKDLNITTYDQAKALIAQIREHGNLSDTQEKALDTLIALNNERVFGIKQSRLAALAGNEEAQRMAAARGEAGYFTLATNDAAEATDGFATAAELAKRQNVDLGASLHDATKGFVDLESEVDKTLGLFDKLAGRPIDVAKALIDVKDKTADYVKGLEDSKAVTDLNTQAGRDNVKSLTDVLASIRAVTEGQIKGGASVKEATKSYEDQIAGLRKSAKEAGLTNKQFDFLLATLQATPKDIETDLKLSGVTEATDALTPYNELISKLDEPVQTEIRQLGAVDAAAAVDLLNKKLDELSVPRKLEIQAEIIAGSFNVLNEQIRAAAEKAGQTPNAPQVRFRALGGIDYPHYALGGIADKSPRIVPAGSNVRIFGEPDTGGEAFIPLAADARRGRAVDITADVAGRFGFDLTPKSLAVGSAQMSAAGFDDSRMVSTLAQGFEALSGQIGALRGTVAAMEAGVTVQMAVPPGQSAEAQGARAGQAFRQVARSR